MRTLALVAVCLSACASDPGQQHYRLEGDCTAPPESKQVTVRAIDFRCDVNLAEATTIDSQAMLDATLGRFCELGATIDFSAEQVLLVRGWGGNGSASVTFLADNGLERALGLMYRPTGYPFPDLALIVPRTRLPLKVHTCQQVCVTDCDRAIP